MLRAGAATAAGRAITRSEVDGVAADLDAALAEAHEVHRAGDAGRAGVVGGDEAAAGGLRDVPVAEGDVVGIEGVDLVVADEPAAVVVLGAAHPVTVGDDDVPASQARRDAGERRHVGVGGVRGAPDGDVEVVEDDGVAAPDADHVQVGDGGAVY